MGNSKSTSSLEVIRNPKEPDLWKVQENIGHCDLVTNIETGEQAESYTIPLDGRIKLEKEYEIYEYRRAQSENLIRVYEVTKKDSEYLCSGIDFLNIKTQRIPYRLNEIKQLLIPEIIYSLHATLVGCKRIKELNGPVKIDGNMIGITQNGEIRVWLNQNIAKNHPELEYEFDPYVSIEEAEKQMVSQIIQAVKLQVKDQEFPQKITERIGRNQIETFDQALEIIKEIAHSLGINLDNTRISFKADPGTQNKQTSDSNLQTHQYPTITINQSNVSQTSETNKSSPKQQPHESTESPKNQLNNQSSHSSLNNPITPQHPQPLIKPYQPVLTFTTYSHTKIPDNHPIESKDSIPNPLLHSKHKPPRPTSSKALMNMQESMNDSKRSESREGSKNKSFTNIQSLSPSRKPSTAHSQSLSLSNSKNSLKNLSPLVKSHHEEKPTEIKPYTLPTKNHLEVTNRVEKPFALTPPAFPYSSSIPVAERSPIGNRSSEEFVRKPSVEKVNPVFVNPPSSMTYNNLGYYFEENAKTSEPSFAPLSKPTTAGKPYENIEKGIAILRQRIDFDQYKS